LELVIWNLFRASVIGRNPIRLRRRGGIKKEVRRVYDNGLVIMRPITHDMLRNKAQETRNKEVPNHKCQNPNELPTTETPKG